MARDKSLESAHAIGPVAVPVKIDHHELVGPGNAGSA